jgi:K+/H+ antiporter YhaU regulatory subunit KhtT
MKDLFGMIDPTITFGNIIEIVVIAVGGVAVLVRLNSTVAVLKADVSSMKEEIKKMAEVLTNQAVLDTRMAAAEQDIRDLRLLEK